MHKALFLLSLLLFSDLQAQEPEKLGASEIFEEIQKLNFLGTVLYVAAHPDDENTRLISYLSNKKNARTVYLSLTRGDGGQNLLGPELRELLGVIRTQELLAARKIDKGEQLFTRANDFGYSKNPEETLRIWEEKEVLKDVVGAIRKLKPDIIINRFSRESAGETHGHHTASALLSTKAFHLAGQEEAFPEQAERLGTWSPQKLFFNTSPWFYESQEAFEALDKSNFLQVDTGTWFPLPGLSNTEIAALSRSQHRSQGFGSTGSRGQAPEYIELVAGEQPPGNKQIFAGIDTSWNRIEGGEKIGRILSEVEEHFDFRKPSASIPELLKAYGLIRNLNNDHWRTIKLKQIKKIIAASAGLFLEAVASEPLTTPGDTVKLALEAINRSDFKMILDEILFEPVQQSVQVAEDLENNRGWHESFKIQIPEEVSYSSPYWLRETGSLGMYKVKQPDLRGLPETPKQFKVNFMIRIHGVSIPFERTIVYKKNDPVEGEVYRPFEIVPEISVSTAGKVLVFPDHRPLQVSVKIKAYTDSVSGELKHGLAAPWSATPESFEFGPLAEGAEETFIFEVKPPVDQSISSFSPTAIVEKKEYSDEVVQIDYEHIPLQTLVLPNRMKIVRLQIEKRGELIGYIAGAGDAVPEALEQMGYRVEVIDPQEISLQGLRKYDAVVTGVRAYNTVDALARKQQVLLDYVKAGGTMVVQYNTNRGIKTDQLAPYPLVLSRDRVTDEKAPVSFFAQKHPVLHVPNEITAEDFEGWVQERGLYFPHSWGEEFQPVLSMKDPGEVPTKGSLLIAPFGKGHYVYTGLSFFRQFPAGVPGAFRLFANLLSLGQDKTGMNQ